MALAAALAGSVVAAPAATAAQADGGGSADCPVTEPVQDLANCLVASRPVTGGSSSSSSGSGTGTRVAGTAAGAAVEDEAVIVGQTVRADDGVQVTFERAGTGAATQAGSADEGVGLFLAPKAASASAEAPAAPDAQPTPNAPQVNAPQADTPELDTPQAADAQPAATAQAPAAPVQAAPQDTLKALGDWQAQASGCSRQSPAGTVVLMPRPAAAADPGDGSTGYCWLDALSEGKTAVQAGAQAASPLVYLPADTGAQTVRVTVSSDPVPVLSVDIDRRDGVGFQNALATQLPAAVPNLYNIGFAGCGCLLAAAPTIRNVVVATGQTSTEVPVLTPPAAPAAPAAPERPAAPATPKVVEEDRTTQQEAASLSLVKRATPPKGRLEAGDDVDYTFTLTNSGDTDLANLAVTDPLITDIDCPAPSEVLEPGEAANCTGTYELTEADVRAGLVVNTAHATATSGMTPVRSNPSTATVRITARPSCEDDGPCKPRFEPCRDMPWYLGGFCDQGRPSHGTHWHGTHWHGKNWHGKNWHGKHWHDGKPCFKRHHRKPRHHGRPHHHVKHEKRHKKPRLKKIVIREKKPLL
ncbi:hypothetical protein GCM10022221_60950 [Actinocorallia aurea]